LSKISVNKFKKLAKDLYPQEGYIRTSNQCWINDPVNFLFMCCNDLCQR